MEAEQRYAIGCVLQRTRALCARRALDGAETERVLRASLEQYLINAGIPCDDALVTEILGWPEGGGCAA